ncbi:MAG TPA: DUF1570 domain-containing protein, partial [Planctomycetota bacterium]|nr:DUF1570 domain-containing protein [Planctomycetota bacterium]
KELRGRVVRESEKEVVLRIGSVDRKLPRAQVRSVDCVATKHRALMQTWLHTKLNDPKALVEVADMADRAGLPHEARLFRWYSLRLRPDDAATHEALGNRQVKGDWIVRLGSREAKFREADALGADFANAWALRSEHFAIRCAAGLPAALDTLLMLELHYHTFHDRFGKTVELLELVEPIDVRLYRDRAQMPNLSNNVGAYFSGSEPALFTCWEDGRAFAIMHESTHALLHWHFVRAAASRGELPAWLNEGWAEYMDGLYDTRVPGKPQPRQGSVQGQHSARLAASTAEERYGVHRLLNFKASDFGASSRQDLKYAQSWALFRFLFEHEDSSLRQIFSEYLGEAARGQGQASTFRRLFARHERMLETKPWQ